MPFLDEHIQTDAASKSRPAVLHLKPAGAITGKVINQATGKPVSSIHLIGPNGDVITNDRGEYRVDHVRAGTYVVWVNPRNRIGLTALIRKDIKVTEGETTTGQDLVLIGGCVVTGQITEADTGHGVRAVVLAQETGGNDLDITFTDSDGKYALRVPPGAMRIYPAVAPGSGYSTAEFDSRDASMFVAVDGQASTRDMKLTPLAGKPVTGRVLDPDGKPRAGAVVKVQKPGDYTRDFGSVRTNERGEFLLPAVTPGSRLWANAGQMGTLEPLAVAGGEQNITLRMAPNTRTALLGTVLDSNGNPIEHATILLDKMHGLSGSKGPAALTNASGRFQIPNLLAGWTYQIDVVADGYTTASMKVPFKPGEPTFQLGEIKLSK